MRYELDHIRNLLESHGYDIFLHGTEDISILCPFCPEDDPDTKGKNYVTPSKGIYHCFRCHEAGSIRYLFKKLNIPLGNERVSTERLKERLARIRTLRKFGKRSIPEKSEYTDLPDEYEPLKKGECYGLAKMAYRFLQKRGLKWRIIREWRIGYCASGPYAQRIILPFLGKDGQVCTFQARRFLGSAGPKSRNPFDDSIALSRADLYYGMHRAKNFDNFVLVEGPFDVIACYEFFRAAGLKRFSALGICGTEISEVQIRLLQSFDPKIVYVLLDADAKEKGKTLGGELLRYCPKVRVAEIPEGDPDELSAEEFVKIISAAYKPRPRPHAKLTI